MKTVACGLVLALICAAPPSAKARTRSERPTWLVAMPGVAARVDIAPWQDADEPEAALTMSAASLARTFSDDATRPDDILYQPAGVRVRIVRVSHDGTTVLVHGIGSRFQGYAPLTRLVPEVPNGTIVVAAGGFGGFADFYAALDTPQLRAGRIATGTRLLVLGTGVAPYDPDSADLVRLHVRIAAADGPGKYGWIAVAYAGLPQHDVRAGAQVAEQVCRCLLLQLTPLR